MKHILTTTLSAAAGSGKESMWIGMLAAAATAVTGYLGGWDIALKLLVFCMVADYITGLLSAIRNKNVNSEVMFWGGVRKGVVLLVIIMAVLLDQFVGNAAPVFRTVALYFYIGREGLSIVENLGELGVPLPGALVKLLEQLNRKGEDR